ncbi:uncharacterized protein LTR77_001147 [Saxophila tyrrhenica]|uniref:Uncharacterized protein n=1 Tax=Saxophila tyrrhenica TaxID=1690608 RepID=A0AAV9PP29_9PEZI|nr:hypothetical protein LTR77_001147 [Saxophila tyrrhenica]
MFSKKRKQQDLATQKGLGIAVQPPPQSQQKQAQSRPTPPAQPLPPAPHTRTTSSGSGKPLVSPLQMTFDFELPPSPALSTQSPYKSSLEGEGELRPKTSDGTLNRKTGMSLAPPMLPPIRRVASKESSLASEGGVELEGSTPPRPPSSGSAREVQKKKSASSIGHPPPLPPPPPEPPSFARFDSDNVSTSSSKSRRKSRIKSFFGFEPPPDLSSISRPSSSSGTPRMTPRQVSTGGETTSRPATSGGDSTPIKMESSLFPSREPPPPALPSFDTGTPAMTRAWIDARDKPYGPPSAAPPRPPPLQPAQSSPDLSVKARSPSAKTNFSKRSPLVTAESPASGTASRQSPQTYFSSSPAGNTVQRLPSHAPTNYSGSTARSTMSSKSTAATDNGPIQTVGTPYQETSPSFPLPQHGTTRPKTAGHSHTPSSIGGVNIPTHHSSALPRSADSTPKPTDPPPKSSEKAEKRKTRLLNPLALLSRRRSAQDDSSNPTTSAAEKAAQAAALARQRHVAATGSISRIPDDYDPRIRGAGVHDFSRPRDQKFMRGFSYNDAEYLAFQREEERERMEESLGVGRLVAGEAEEGEEALLQRGPKLTFAHQSFLASPVGSPSNSTFPATTTQRQSARSPNHNPSTSQTSSKRTTGFFQEHLNDTSGPADSASAVGGRVQAERLENKDFLQRASFLSQQSGVSSNESGVLPVFARRSGVVPEDGRGYGQRFSGGEASEGEGVSPVTSALADVRLSQNISPVSPSTSDPRISSASAQPSSSDRSSAMSELQQRRKSRVKSGNSIGSSLSDTWSTGRPFSSTEQAMPKFASTTETETETQRGGPPISITIPSHPAPAPAPVREPPEIPARGTSAAAAASLGTGAGAGARASSPLSTINSPSTSAPDMDLPSDAPTPEPMVAEGVRFSTAQPGAGARLVEKRRSAVGHARRSGGAARSAGSGKSGNGGVPKHHVSNASRFSFQLGSAEEERALEAKAREVRERMGIQAAAPQNGRGGQGAGQGDDGSEEDFDEDAMDDLDEMEMMGLNDRDSEDEDRGVGDAVNHASQRPVSTAPSAMIPPSVTESKRKDRASVANFLYRPASAATTPSSTKPTKPGHGHGHENRTSTTLQMMVNDREDGDSEEEDEEEEPYWMHEDFLGYEDGGAEGERRPSMANTASPMSPRAGGFYMQPKAAAGAHSLSSQDMAPASTQSQERSRDSGGSGARAIDLPFATTTIDADGRMTHQSQQRSSGGSSSNAISLPFATTMIDANGRMTHTQTRSQHTPAMSSSTFGENSSSSASDRRTLSAGLGLSGFSDFRFGDSASSSRPGSMGLQGPLRDSAVAGPPRAKEEGGERKENRRTRDSETIPYDVDWTAEESAKASPAIATRGIGGWDREWRRRDSSPLVNVAGAKPGAAGKGERAMDDDDMYFDDGGFGEDVDAASSPAVGGGAGRNGVRTADGKVVGEERFDDDDFLARNNNNTASRPTSNGIPHTSPPPPPPPAFNPLLQPTHHQQHATSLGSDGPYPSFAMPNPLRARERDSRLLLEDLPLHAGPGPVDPSLLPRRNPSEDAKRLGLSSRAPPLPAQQDLGGEAQRVQERLTRYHAALAEAANRAAAEGRFVRAPSSATESVRSHMELGRSDSTGGEEEEEAAGGAAQMVDENTTAGDKSHDVVSGGAPYSLPKLSFDFGFDTSRFSAGELDFSTDALQSNGVSNNVYANANGYDSTNGIPCNSSTAPNDAYSSTYDSTSAIPNDDLDDSYDDFDYEDDDIISAANASALASDDAGFYGQEFGFFARSRPTSRGKASKSKSGGGRNVPAEPQAINGGFFGAEGDDGLARQKSLREPNLTPITERSEFSTRNSFVFGPASAGGWGSHSAARFPPLSPGLVGVEGEGVVTSFEELRRLRGAAFAGGGGGSQGSLRSEGRGSQGSLQGYFSGVGGVPMAVGWSQSSEGSQGQLGQSPHSASSSGHLPFSVAEEGREGVDATPKRASAATSGVGSGQEVQSPTTVRKASHSNTLGRAYGHSRNSSGADSVTYVQERDPDGSGPPRWVLERRRTSEMGEVEVVGREVVQGGWI